MYKYYQPNKLDLKDNYGDCVVRAITKAEDISWLNTFDALVSIARVKQCTPNSRPCYEVFFKEHNYLYSGISNKKGSKRPTVKSFAASHPDGTYVLRLANHLVCVKDGHYYDIWDCANSCLYGYWYKIEG